jgi:UDP-3-O-[3-hydroxymyristoyl] glucosamine N-acyltransferase
VKLSDIAAKLGCPVEGDGSVEIRGVGSLDDATAGQLTFLGNPKYAEKAKTTKASAILLGKDAASTGIPAIRVPDPYASFAEVISWFHPAPRPAEPGIHPTAVVAKSARIGEGAAIGPFVVIGENVVIGRNACLGAHVVLYRDVTVGDDALFHARVTVRERCRIGSRVRLEPGVVIGSDGFGFTKLEDGTHKKIPHVGNVVIEDDVEIQANSCIDRATLGETRIGRGTKIDNLVQVGHNCILGENDILCALVGLSGTTTLGKNVTLAGQAACSGHLTVGDGVVAIAKSGIAHDVEPGAVVSGAPAIDAKVWMKYTTALPRLPDLIRDVRALGRRVDSLEGARRAPEGPKAE